MTIYECKADITIPDNGVAIYTTDVINGLLEGIYICTETAVNVLITFDEASDVVLFDNKNKHLVGDYYFPIRQLAMSKDLEGFTYSHEKWALNNKLKIYVEGIPNTTSYVYLRYS